MCRLEGQKPQPRSVCTVGLGLFFIRQKEPWKSQLSYLLLLVVTDQVYFSLRSLFEACYVACMVDVFAMRDCSSKSSVVVIQVIRDMICHMSKFAYFTSSNADLCGGRFHGSVPGRD